MNIKVGNEYLDFTDDVEMERQVKLFEEAATTDGDFSYAFIISATKKNRGIFDLFSINQNGKIIYSKIPAILENNSGQGVYFGYIKVERDTEKEIEASFFSGNNNWFNDLDFDLRDFDFSQYDEDWTLASIQARETATSGVIFPVIDTGALSERSYVNWHIDEIHPFIYVHSVIKTLLNRNSIKLTGDILTDWRYTHLITSNSDAATPQDEINSRSVNVNKTATQTIDTTPELVTFPITTGVYFPGDLWNTGTNQFTADVRMVIKIELTVAITTGAANIGAVLLFVNGANFTGPFIESSGSTSVSNSVSPETTSASVTILLQAGDTVDFQGAAIIGNYDINSATLKITPVRLLYVFSSLLLPDVKAKDFVTSIFSLFNPLINYDGNSKVLNVDLFKNVIRKPEIDISKYIDTKTIEQDYSELMENYGQSNLLTYSESDSDVSQNYNKGNGIPFGGGGILSENEIAQPSVPVLESDFVAAMEDQTNPFKTFLPKLAWRSLSESDPRYEDITGAVSATDPGPGLTFTHPATGSPFTVGDIVKIYDATPSTPGDDVSSYNGQWIVTSATSTTFRVAGLSYTYDAQVNVVRLQIEFESNGEQALLLALPNIGLSDFTYNTLMFYAESGALTGISSPATAYFYKPLQDLAVDDYKEGLSFGPVNVPNAHQITMIASYWMDFQKILLDPVKVIAETHYPLAIFNQLFDGPLRIKTKRFNALFFMNRVTGYKASHLPCDSELIKL